jgi:hypothetical protein
LNPLTLGKIRSRTTRSGKEVAIQALSKQQTLGSRTYQE